MTTLQAPFDSREIFAAARAGDAFAHEIVDEVARRIALHLVPIAAVGDVSLAVLAVGWGAGGDLLLRPVRELLAGWMPYPPQGRRLQPGRGRGPHGALAVGLRAALDNVFVGRPRRAAR